MIIQKILVFSKTKTIRWATLLLSTRSSYNISEFEPLCFSHSVNSPVQLSILFTEYVRGRRGRDRRVIGNYLCIQYISPLMLWVRISIRARCTTLCDKVCQSLAAGRWFSLGPLVSSTYKTDLHDITEILLKVALNTDKQAENFQRLLWSWWKSTIYI